MVQGLDIRPKKSPDSCLEQSVRLKCVELLGGVKARVGTRLGEVLVLAPVKPSLPLSDSGTFSVCFLGEGETQFQAQTFFLQNFSLPLNLGVVQGEERGVCGK